MQLITDTNFNFMRRRQLAIVFSLSLIAISCVSLIFRGLSFGIDFTGGTVVEVAYESPAEIESIREQLSLSGFEDAEVQYFGTVKDVVIRLAPDKAMEHSELSNIILDELRKTNKEMELRRVEYVGPKVGEELRESGGLALLYALVGILLYVAFRFEYRFAFGAIIALTHDVIITIGFFSLTGIDFDLTVLAAILAVIGYSLNDTIVVYDRIRENFVKRRKKIDSEEIINKAINQTLARTVITSLTTLLVLIALLIFGGEGLTSFTTAMIVGVIVGTYSSIYIAGSSLLFFRLKQKDMEPVKKEGQEFGKV